MTDPIVSKTLILRSHKLPSSSLLQFLRKHMIYFKWWTLQLFAFISEAARRGKLSPSHKYIYWNRAWPIHQILLKRHFMWILLLWRISSLKIKLNLIVEEICRDYSLNFLWDKCHCTRLLFSIFRGIIISLRNILIWSVLRK